ncbi:ribosomal protection-like ABC-F family protein [Dysgonomonas sp. 511]|uniref:ribosomal protection-like ABC-F family protein n=1 Tax=Dysgonomonas sp. 511 TaxID=2302930 RepID=UPI0013D75581|nr:ABC-F family ATP-binding cassette domain-containing protein [Dysgonomonas sp. 511]NDV79669.1 ABC transporter ATP-binding protein [Dysgonomonas sp. 511]
MLILQDIAYSHPNKDLLFDNISLTVNNHDKVALIGNNGSGKSTLLKIISGSLPPSSGRVVADSKPYFIPQIFGQYNHLTIAEALNINVKLKALEEILAGNATEENMLLLDDDWTIDQRCREALNYWQLDDLDLNLKMSNLSGGQKTKVFLAGIHIHQPEFVLLDEPSNHLDVKGREQLYDFIQTSNKTLLIVSHDRKLLNLLNLVCELSKHGITVYGGNYDFYAEQKQLQREALDQDIKSKEKALRKAKEKERETIERQQKLDARGKKKQEKAGTARIMMNTLRNKAENSTSKVKDIHADRIDGIFQELKDLRASATDTDKMKLGFDNSSLHKGKVLFTAKDVNFSYSDRLLWPENLNFQIVSGERIALKGLNGSGKTTLIKIILGNIVPQEGDVYIADNKTIYIDQDYSLINNVLSVYQQAELYNNSGLQEHEIKSRLNRFLFTKQDWDKPCESLSGGERMRLILCCLTISNQAPDIIVLDEPTNNLDIQSMEILTMAINEYRGTLIVVSHDSYFLEQINIERFIKL